MAHFDRSDMHQDTSRLYWLVYGERAASTWAYSPTQALHNARCYGRPDEILVYKDGELQKLEGVL